MASVANDPNGRKRILFVAPDGSRPSIRLGKCDRKFAESICRHVEALLIAKLGAQPVQRETAVWLSSIGATFRDKLAAVGLVEAPKRAVLGEFLKNYILNRPDVKPATLKIWQQPCRNLTEFFGEDKPLRSITSGDADQFKAWLMTQKLAAATVAKRLSFARTFLTVARKNRLIDENPLSEMKIPTACVKPPGNDSSTAIPWPGCLPWRTRPGEQLSLSLVLADYAVRPKCCRSSGGMSIGKRVASRL